MRTLAKEQFVVYSDDLKGFRENKQSDLDESLVKRRVDKIKSQFLRYDHESKKLNDLNSYMTNDGSELYEENMFAR